jgi:uncharacterized protein (TIGR02147 family)
MKTINIMNHTKLEEYLSELILFLRETRPSFSYRNLASKLDWPVSLLTDVISSRKTLPLVRGLELASYLKLTDYETEHLIQMTLANTSNTEVQNYFQKILNKKVETKEYSSSVNQEHYLKLNYLIIYDYLKMKKYIPQYEEVNSDLYFININKLEFDRIIDDLLLKGFIKISNSNELKILKGNLFSDDKTVESTDSGMIIHQNFIENLKSFCIQPTRPFTLNSGFIAINENDYKFLLDKILQFRNSIIALDRSSKEVYDNERLYQFDFNFFPLTKKPDKPSSEPN